MEGPMSDGRVVTVPVVFGDLAAEVERLRVRLATEEGIAAENCRLMSLWQGREAKAVEEIERLRAINGEIAADVLNARGEVERLRGELAEAIAQRDQWNAEQFRSCQEWARSSAEVTKLRFMIETYRRDTESAEASLATTVRERDEARGELAEANKWIESLTNVHNTERARAERLEVALRETRNVLTNAVADAAPPKIGWWHSRVGIAVERIDAALAPTTVTIHPPDKIVMFGDSLPSLAPMCTPHGRHDCDDCYNALAPTTTGEGE